VKIIRDLGTREVIDSFAMIKEITGSVDDIIEILKSPEMVRNMENIQLISVALGSASTNVKTMQAELHQTGITGETKLFIEAIKDKLGKSKREEKDFASAGNMKFQDLRFQMP